MQRRTFANRSFESCKLAMIAAHPMSLHFTVRFRMMHGTLCFAWSIWIVGRCPRSLDISLKSSYLLTHNRQVTRPHLERLWACSGRRTRKDYGVNTRRVSISVRGPSHHAQRHQALQRPGKFKRKHQALRLWRSDRVSRQFCCEHIRRDFNLHGAGTYPRRSILNKIRCLECRPDDHGIGNRQIPFRQ
jgi:hypothetical protein